MRRHRQLSSTSARPRWGTRSRAILTLLVSGLLVAGAAVPAQAGSGSASARMAPAPALGCDHMVGQKVSVTGDVARVASTTAVAASGATSAYCEVQGTIGDIRFTMRLPIADWNGRYFQTVNRRTGTCPSWNTRSRSARACPRTRTHGRTSTPSSRRGDRLPVRRPGGRSRRRWLHHQAAARRTECGMPAVHRRG